MNPDRRSSNIDMGMHAEQTQSKDIFAQVPTEHLVLAWVNFKKKLQNESTLFFRASSELFQNIDAAIDTDAPVKAPLPSKDTFPGILKEMQEFVEGNWSMPPELQKPLSYNDVDISHNMAIEWFEDNDATRLERATTESTRATHIWSDLYHFFNDLSLSPEQAKQLEALGVQIEETLAELETNPKQAHAHVSKLYHTLKGTRLALLNGTKHPLACIDSLHTSIISS